MNSLTEAAAARHLGITRARLRELRGSHLERTTHYERTGGSIRILPAGVQRLAEAISKALDSDPPRDTPLPEKTDGARLARALEAAPGPIVHRAMVTRTWGPAKLWIEAELAGENPVRVAVRVKSARFFSAGMAIEVREDGGRFFFHGRMPTKPRRAAR